jgi:hypothetical protein
MTMLRSLLLSLSLGTLSLAPPPLPNLPPQQLPVYGGTSGPAFTRSCGPGKVLTGLRYRAGALVDAVGVLCRPVNANGTLGSETTVGAMVGGSGGTSGSASCGTGKVVVGATIYFGSFVNGMRIVCRSWDAASRKFLDQSTSMFPQLIGNFFATNHAETCEAPTQPANGIRGRAVSLVDAIGFICDEP